MASRPTEEPPFVDSTAALASLYQAPFAEFVARRTALVSQLKRSGHKDVAARMAAAPKPSRAAYLVNQVYWQARATYDAVLEAGTTARAAQQARLLGDASTDLAETLRRRDEAVRAATSEATRIASRDGQAASGAAEAQVRASFEALAAHGLESRLTHGHLVADVDLPGLAAFAGLILPATPPPTTVRRFEVVSRRPPPEVPAAPTAEPDPLVAQAEALVSDLEQRQASAVERLAELERGAVAARAVAAAAEQAALEAARAAEEARQAVSRAEATQAAVAQDLARVTAQLDEARRAWQRLTGPSTPDPTTPAPDPTNPAPARPRGRRPSPRPSRQ